MEFYFEKLSGILKEKRITLSELSRRADVSRVTLWRVIKGEKIPKEKYVRAIAKVLDIGVEEISSLPPNPQLTDKDLGEEKKLLKKWISFDDSDETKRAESYKSIVSTIQEKFIESDKAIRLVKILINFSNVMLYVKDHKQKYMAASRAFLDLVSIPDEFSIFGKTDADIFGVEDGKRNTEEDARIILSGESVKNREDYIPGSRKKRYGLISKTPTFDNKGKITGIVGAFIDITQRKKTEFLANDLKRCIEFLENRIIWLGSGKILELPNKSLCPKEIIYLSDSLSKIKHNDGFEISSDFDHMGILDSLKETPIEYDFAKIKKEGFSTIYYRMKSPDKRELLNCKSSIYYIEKFDLYFGITELDIVTSYTDLLLNDIERLSLDNESLQKIKEIITSCKGATQARIEYDKYINMKEVSGLDI